MLLRSAAATLILACAALLGFLPFAGRYLVAQDRSGTPMRS
jgi:hypothetical protein